MISLESYFLAHTIQTLFPLSKFEKAGQFGDLTFVDFILPFEVNSDLLSQIQENLKMLIKSDVEHQVFHMVPRVAKDFLNHHHQKKLAVLIDDEEPFVDIVQIEKTFYLSESEVSKVQPRNQIKVLDSKKYLNGEGGYTTRFYSIFENDQKELKNKVKIAQPFLKRDLLKKLISESVVGEKEGSYFLREKGLFFEFDLIKEFSQVVKVLDLELADIHEEGARSGYVQINKDFDLAFYRGPYFDFSHLDTQEPFFKAQALIKKEILKSGLKKFFDYFVSFLKKYKIEYEVKISSGAFFAQDFLMISEQMGSKLLESKSQKRANVKISMKHPLNFETSVLDLHLELKQQDIFLKFEAFQQIVGIYSWIEDASC